MDSKGRANEQTTLISVGLLLALDRLQHEQKEKAVPEVAWVSNVPADLSGTLHSMPASLPV